MTRAPRLKRPLQGDQPDAAGRRVDHDHLSAPDPPHSSQQAFRRQPLEHRRGGEAVAHPLGNAHQPLCGHHSLLHVGAGLRVRVGDAIAGRETPHPATDLLDDARRLASGHQRQRALVEPGALVHIDEIEPDRGVADQHFAAAGVAGRNLLPAKDLGTAICVDADAVRHQDPAVSGASAMSRSVTGSPPIRCSMMMRSRFAGVQSRYQVPSG